MDSFTREQSNKYALYLLKEILPNLSQVFQDNYKEYIEDFQRALHCNSIGVFKEALGRLDTVFMVNNNAPAWSEYISSGLMYVQAINDYHIGAHLHNLSYAATAISDYSQNPVIQLLASSESLTLEDAIKLTDTI